MLLHADVRLKLLLRAGARLGGVVRAGARVGGVVRAGARLGGVVRAGARLRVLLRAHLSLEHAVVLFWKICHFFTFDQYTFGGLLTTMVALKTGGLVSILGALGGATNSNRTKDPSCFVVTL